MFINLILSSELVTIVRACNRHRNETVTLIKLVIKYKYMRKWMVEFLSKSQSCGIKFARVNSIRMTKSNRVMSVGFARLVCESVGKDLLSDHFDSNQSRESVDLLVTCHPFPSLITFVFRSSEVKRLLLDLDPYGGTWNLLVCFLSF